MALSDVSPLFHLSVGLNLGFGALVFFYEPLGAKTDKSIEIVERHIMRITDKEALPKYQLDAIFRVCKLYQSLIHKRGALRIEHDIWDGIIAKLVFMISGLLSFILLTICAVEPHASSNSMIIAGVVVNLPPLIFVITIFFIAAQNQLFINPLLSTLQTELFENFIKGRVNE
jgi:hypothetical protein